VLMDPTSWAFHTVRQRAAGCQQRA
jgi:hypothetical protein